MRLQPPLLNQLDAWCAAHGVDGRPEGIRILIEGTLTTPPRTKLINEWMTLIIDIGNVGLDIFLSADMSKTDRGFADVKSIALTLLTRTLSNIKGVMLQLDAKRIVEARIVTRCVLENFYWIIGLATEGDAFARKMYDDEINHRRAQGQQIFDAEIALEAGVRQRLRDFLRDSKPQSKKAPSLTPKQVARIRRGFEKTHIFYGQLSSDAHPSFTALNRYVVPETHPAGGGFDIEPVVTDREIEETCDYLCMAAVGVCVAANQILGGVPAAAALNGIAERYAALSPMRPLPQQGTQSK